MIKLDIILLWLITTLNLVICFKMNFIHLNIVKSIRILLLIKLIVLITNLVYSFKTTNL